MSQTTYQQDFDAGLPGGAHGVGPKSVEGRLAEGAMNFGFAVVLGTDPEGEVILPSAASETVVGVTLRSAAYRDDGEATDVIAGETVNVIRQGEVYVTVEDAVTAGGDAFFNHTAGNEGQFRSDNDGGNADQLAGARFKTSAGAGEIAVLELNLP